MRNFFRAIKHFHLRLRIGAVSIKIFSPAKTVADFFKFRNKFGIDIAIEALREGWQKHLFTSDELYMAAKECRVSRVIEPYIESIIL